jgi:hypothetical protein
MVDFAIVLPLLFFLLFGVLEFGFMMFSIGTARYAAGEGARRVAQVGASTELCSSVPLCPELYPSNIDCDADCHVISSINNTALGTTGFATVRFIAVTKLVQTSQGQLVPEGCAAPGPGCSPAHVNYYTLKGTPCALGGPSGCTPSLSGVPVAGTYPTNSRNDIFGQSDFIEVTIDYRYNWLSGLFNQIPKPALTASFDLRIEPQRYAA